MDGRREDLSLPVLPHCFYTFTRRRHCRPSYHTVALQILGQDEMLLFIDSLCVCEWYHLSE